MTGLNHIGVFLLLWVVWTIIAFLDKSLDDSKVFKMGFFVAILLFIVFELFYWIIQIFFCN